MSAQVRHTIFFHLQLYDCETVVQHQVLFPKLIRHIDHTLEKQANMQSLEGCQGGESIDLQFMHHMHAFLQYISPHFRQKNLDVFDTPSQGFREKCQ